MNFSGCGFLVPDRRDWKKRGMAEKRKERVREGGMWEQERSR